MKITVNEKDGCGTCLQGSVSLNYDQIVDKLGEPTEGDGFKVDAHWVVYQEETDTTATIYNWKNGRNYWGVDGTPANQITDWNIGGFDGNAVDLVYAIFKDEMEVEVNPCELALCEPESDPTSHHHHSYLESDDFEPSTDGAPCGYDDTHGL